MNYRDTQWVVKPPWVQYPGSEPTWGGWRQGTSEAWLHNVWLPFWKGLATEERDAYLLQQPPPNDEWQLYLTQFWR